MTTGPRKNKNKAKVVTLDEIGAEAGVSKSIVSRVLRNKNDRIPEATRKRVFEAAEKLKYRRNLLVRAVQTGHSMNVGVIIPSTGSFYSEIVHGIHDEFMKGEYCILLAWISGGTVEQATQQERELLHKLVDRRVDGIIMLPTRPDASEVYFSEVQERKIPLITVDRLMPSVSCDFSGSDNEEGGHLAARHLIELGHRHLLHIAIDTPFGQKSRRLKGFEDECSGSPDVSLDTLHLKHGLDQEKHPRDVIRTYMSGSPSVTGVSLSTDNLMLDFYHACGDLGLQVPQDLSVVGFGNLEQCIWMDPPLTSIDQKPYVVGRNAAQLILKRIQGESNSNVHLLEPPELIVRGSTAVVN